MTTLYTREHEWIRIEGETGTVGITAYAAEKLGDVVFVDLPDAGRKVKKDAEMAVVESVKAASDVYAPVSGEVTESNAALQDAPETVNSDPEGAGWFCRIRMSDPSETSGLMNETAYAEFCKGL
ncbi:MAG: glycine cleavage system protein GcvH [Chitinophagia bacterium]|nr:glycine cleavage system protein GcvH [Chitinophagia bacterium]